MRAVFRDTKAGYLAAACGICAACTLACLLAGLEGTLLALTITGGICWVLLACRPDCDCERCAKAAIRKASRAANRVARRAASHSAPSELPGHPENGRPLTDWETGQLIGIMCTLHTETAEDPHAGQPQEGREP